ncbi:response regulator [Mesorhizobium denitrificans]|uniref:response regulator n=1 Tax=Mesorhizobium denitrificans TaxID=2294114 RepID=UPI003CCAD538
MTSKVLVVEDEPLLLMNIADELVEEGFDVIESPNADHAMVQLASNPEIGVLFTDVDMPGSLDGLALSSIVHKRWPHVIIIVTSGKLSAEKAQLPPDAIFIAKPYAVTELICAINAQLGE